ncbi:MAG: AAA family ATPase, partial [Armatimonadia bacterium]|nr:AAA family ATPase [Armatimonadia bacterium]
MAAEWSDCAQCGLRVPWVAYEDGSTAPPHFCSRCGKALSSSDAEAAPDGPWVLSSAQKRPIVVLMADISGYSGLSETMELDWLYEVLKEVLSQLSECVIHHGGHIDKYVGDEIIALFGYPRAVEDAADRALHAASAMHSRMAELNRANEHLVGRDLELHIGINAGTVMSGPLGHALAQERTVIGDAVNIAKRLEAAAPSGETYLSGSVRERLRGRFSLEALGSLDARGREGRVEAYRLLEDRPPLPERGSSADVWMPRPALAALMSEALKSRESTRPGVLLVGGPGLGKTCLGRRWAKNRQPDACAATIDVVSTSVNREIPYWALGELFTEAGLAAHGSGPATDDRVKSGLTRLLSADAPGLEAALGLVEQHRRALAQRRHQPDLVLLRALDALLEGLAHTGPINVLLDNAEYLDASTERLLSWLPLVHATRRGLECWILTSRGREPVALADAWGIPVLEVPLLTPHECSQILERVPG